METLREEKAMRLKGGLYHLTQVKFCYNSNRIEGSRLSEEQTRHIFETDSFIPEEKQPAFVDDILETVNHFKAFDMMLDIADAPLFERQIKALHRVLKNNTSDSRKEWFRTGAYKARPNVVGGGETTPPWKVAAEMRRLLGEYLTQSDITFEEIVVFHWAFERIHPFQDGNGRVGRLIMFKECLRHGILPFIIDEAHKAFYYRGLVHFGVEREYLLETCRSAQDQYRELTQALGIR